MYNGKKYRFLILTIFLFLLPFKNLKKILITIRYCKCKNNNININVII